VSVRAFLGPSERPVLQVVLPEFLHDALDEHVLRVVEAADAGFQVVEALEGAAVALVENVVAELLPDARQQIELVEPECDGLGVVVEVDEPLFVRGDDLLDDVLEFRSGAAGQVPVVDFGEPLDGPLAPVARVDPVADPHVGVTRHRHLQ